MNIFFFAKILESYLIKWNESCEHLLSLVPDHDQSLDGTLWKALRAHQLHYSKLHRRNRGKNSCYYKS